MAETNAPRQAAKGGGRRTVSLVFDRDLDAEEIERIRQQTDALYAAAMMPDAAHHHDQTIR
jgi:hypothetical protein